MTTILDESALPVENGEGRREADRLRALRAWCAARADRKRYYAQCIAPLRYAGLSHEQVRIRLGLGVGDYRRAKRWLMLAIAKCAGGYQPMTLADALSELAERHVELVLRVALLHEQRMSRGKKLTGQQAQQHLGLSRDEWEVVDEWSREGLRAVTLAEDELVDEP